MPSTDRVTGSATKAAGSATKAAGSAGKAAGGATKLLPTDELGGAFKSLLGAVGQRAVGSLHEKVGGMAERLTDYAGQQGNSSLVAAVTGAKDIAEGKSPARSLLGAGMAGLKDKVKNLFGGGGKGNKLKVINIVESIDVGVPVRVAYNQWTEFADFPSFMKKVENVDQNEDEKLTWKAQVFWSHRNWESTIQSQVPDDHIVWKSKGDKGYVDGAVTFHALAPNLTRILLNLEYHPQGMFERTGNIWRAQGRRARLEFKHFHRHVMNNTILHPDEIEGWRGVIEDGEVVKDHETAVREEQEAEAPDARGDSGELDADDTSRDAQEGTADEDTESQPADDEDQAGQAGDKEEPENDGFTDEEPESNGDAPSRRSRPRQGSRRGTGTRQAKPVRRRTAGSGTSRRSAS
jgi:uncharacterized membrane protein